MSDISRRVLITNNIASRSHSRYLLYIIHTIKSIVSIPSFNSNFLTITMGLRHLRLSILICDRLGVRPSQYNMQVHHSNPFMDDMDHGDHSNSRRARRIHSLLYYVLLICLLFVTIFNHFPKYISFWKYHKSINSYSHGSMR